MAKQNCSIDILVDALEAGLQSFTEINFRSTTSKSERCKRAIGNKELLCTDSVNVSREFESRISLNCAALEAAARSLQLDARLAERLGSGLKLKSAYVAGPPKHADAWVIDALRPSGSYYISVAIRTEKR